MNRDLVIFVLVLFIAALVGGLVGAEWSDYDRTFSATGAVVGAIGTAGVLLGLGAFFDRQERRKRQQKLPDDVRGVFDRMFRRKPSQPQSVKAAAPPASVEASRREMGSVDPVKVQTFVSVMSRLGLMSDNSKLETIARAKLRSHPDPVVAALRAQREFLDVLLDRSRGNPSVMGSSIANSCFGLCEMVVEGKVPDKIGREHFNSYIKVFERVHGIKMPFSGGALDYDTSLEIARESLSAKR